MSLTYGSHEIKVPVVLAPMAGLGRAQARRVELEAAQREAAELRGTSAAAAQRAEERLSVPWW